MLLQTVQMDRTLELATNSPTPAALVLPSLPVLWMGQTAVMVCAAMSYKTTLQTAAVNLHCLDSILKVSLLL